MQEIWKVFKETKRVKYEVSNKGNVKRNGIDYQCKINPYNGYYHFGGIYLHSAVAELFITNLENKPCVDHIDGNRLNNDVSNLRYVTYKENSNTDLAINNMIKAQRARNINHNGKNNPMYGKKRDKQWCKSHSKTMKEILSGTKYLTDGTVNVKIKPEYWGEFIDIGFIFGKHK